MNHIWYSNDLLCDDPVWIQCDDMTVTRNVRIGGIIVEDKFGFRWQFRESSRSESTITAAMDNAETYAKYGDLHCWLKDIRLMAKMLNGDITLPHSIGECFECGKARLIQISYEQAQGKEPDLNTGDDLMIIVKGSVHRIGDW